MGWVNPTGHVDHGNWIDEPKGYNDNTADYAYEVVNADTWSSFLDLTIDPISCDKVRFWAYWDISKQNSINLDAYYDDGWHDIYDGAYPNLEYVEKPLGDTYSVTAARVSFYQDWMLGGAVGLYDFDFNEVEAPPAYIPKVIMVTCSPMAKKNGIYRRVKNLWVPPRKLWLPTPPVCVPRGIMMQ